MINWEEIAKGARYESEEAMWRDYYVTKRKTIEELTRDLGVSRNVIRERLIRCAIPVRKQGGPNNSKIGVSDELLTEIRRDGIEATAKRMGLKYDALYKRLRKAGHTSASLRQPLVVSTKPPAVDADQTVNEDVSARVDDEGYSK
jgi:hypothetical protein